MGHLYFVRHGQTYWNVENKICGVTDIALTPLGYEQAEEAGKRILEMQLPIDRIICSPLVRASETARIISEMTGVPVQTDPRLTEQNFGRFEATDRTGQEFRLSKEQLAEDFGGGESMLHLAQRVYNLLDEVKGDPEGKTYLLVAHNGIARCVHSYFYSMTNHEYATFSVQNCEVREYTW